MSLLQSNVNDLKKLSVWIFGVYITANILLYLTTEYLTGAVNESVHRYLNQFLVLLVVGVVIMSLLNSIQLIRKTNFRKNLQWLVMSGAPFFGVSSFHHNNPHMNSLLFKVIVTLYYLNASPHEKNPPISTASTFNLFSE